MFLKAFGQASMSLLNKGIPTIYETLAGLCSSIASIIRSTSVCHHASSVQRSSRSSSLPSPKLHIVLCKGTRSCTTHQISHYVAYDRLFPPLLAFTSWVSSIDVPNTVHEGVSLSEWQTTMEAELSALHENDTWELAPLLPGKSTVGCQWVFKVK